MEKHPATTQAVATLFVGAIAVIQLYKGDEIRKMSPDLMMQIGNQEKVELLQDQQFLKSVAGLVYPLLKDDDKVVIIQPDKKETVVQRDEKDEFLKLAGKEEDVHLEIEKYETLRGRITRVDLDATKNHVGFKIGDKGATILCTLLQDVSQIEMTNLLGQWVQISGTSTKFGEERTHMDIVEFKIVVKPTQEEMPFVYTK